MYHEHLAVPAFAPWCEALIEINHPGPNDRCLDLASGTGAMTFAVADAIAAARTATGPKATGGAVVGLEVELEAMRVAREEDEARRKRRGRGTPAANEDQNEAQLDLDYFRAATGAYLDASPADARADLADAMWLGADWVSLELTARFLADALNENYFAFDAQRFPAAGEHNLHRARGQWSLHRALADSRDARREMLR